MKIALFTDTFAPLVDGVVTSTVNLAKNLADRGNKIYIIAPNFNKKFKEFKYHNIKVKRIYSLPAFFYSGYRFTYPFSFKILKYLKKEKVELIHFQTPVILGLQAILISKILKLPLVGTFHTFFTNADYLKHIKMDYKSVENMAWFYARAYYNKCDLVTCPSEQTKKELLKHGFKKQIKVISNGIDLRIFKNSKYVYTKKKYNKDSKCLLFVGRVAHEKNLKYLIDCFKLVSKKLPEIKLLIVGDGPQMGELKEKIKSSGISNKVILARAIEHEKLIKSSIFKDSSLFITASVTETQGITLLEAQANGLICVGINAGGIKDLIKNGYNGYLVENGDKQKFADRVIKLLKDKKLYVKMKKNTLKEIKKHKIEKVVDSWEEEYSRLINLFKNKSKVYHEEHIPPRKSF